MKKIFSIEYLKEQIMCEVTWWGDNMVDRWNILCLPETENNKAVSKTVSHTDI